MLQNPLIDIVLAVALLGWLAYKQLVWSAMTPAALWRAPGILALVGVISIATGSSSTRFGVVEIGLLVAELAVSVAGGVAMGAVARIRPLSATTVVGRRQEGATLESRAGWPGLLLLVAVIGARVGLGLGAAALGAAALSTTGVILLFVAANRAGRAAMLHHRMAARPRTAVA